MTGRHNENLRTLVEKALAMADAQGLQDVAISLDQAQIVLARRTGEEPVTFKEIERRFNAA
jgi:hypothetical protein